MLIRLSALSSCLVLLLADGTNAQLTHERSVAPAMVAQATPADNPYAGRCTWCTYRSYLNRPDILVGDDPQKAIGLIFGEGVVTFETPSGNTMHGTLDLGSDFLLDLSSTISNSATAPAVVSIVGTGRPGTSTEGWEYDYTGYFCLCLAEWHRPSASDRRDRHSRQAAQWNSSGSGGLIHCGEAELGRAAMA
jgi:hypothetical protein